MRVSIIPGAYALTVILCSASSNARGKLSNELQFLDVRGQSDTGGLREGANGRFRHAVGTYSSESCRNVR